MSAKNARLGADARLDQAGRAAWDELRELFAEILGEGAPSAERETHPETALEALDRCRLLLERVRARETTTQLEQAAATSRQEELLSIVAHDLRTPLVAIQGFAQLLQTTAGSEGLGARQRTYVDRILQAVRSMSRMVDDLRTARHLDQGSLQLQPQPMDLHFFGEGLIEAQREDAERRGVRLRLECQGSPSQARVDRQRLGQALGTLVERAVGRTPEGGEVVVTLQARRGRMKCTVDDRGPPVARPELSDLFVRPSSASSPAKGLGLYICRELVTLHGGRVGVENRPEGGCRTWAEVPLEPPGPPGEVGLP